MSNLTESAIETFTIQLLERQGYAYPLVPKLRLGTRVPEALLPDAGPREAELPRRRPQD
ncbi:MAG: hypothetical protein PHE55_14775 [Methylococcaceae bacterium]|nr:hypothetical protein [Methylococcaceae bacterium]